MSKLPPFPPLVGGGGGVCKPKNGRKLPFWSNPNGMGWGYYKSANKQSLIICKDHILHVHLKYFVLS